MRNILELNPRFSFLPAHNGKLVVSYPDEAESKLPIADTLEIFNQGLAKRVRIKESYADRVR